MPPVCWSQHAGGMSTSGTTLDSVRALEDDFADAMARMYSVGNDLARLRAHLALETSPAGWTPVADPAPEADTQPVATSESGPMAPPPVPPSPPVPTIPWWQRDGVVAKVLAVLGTGITLIGVAFLLALAIQMGFFGPLARVVSGALLAVGLVLAAAVVRHRQRSTVGALGLAATGIATAYLDVLAVTRIYEWVPAAVGLVLAGLLALGGLLLARAWDSQLLGIITVVGVAALAPTVGYDHLLLTGAFLVVLTIASWPAQISRDWLFLEMARVIPTALFVTGLALTDEPALVLAPLTSAFSGFVLATSLGGTRLAALPPHLGPLVPIAALPLLFAGLAVDDRWLGFALLVLLTGMLVLVASLSADAPETPLHQRLTEVGLGTAGLTSLLTALRLVEGTEWGIVATLTVSLVWAASALALGHRMTLHVALATSVLTLLGSLYLLPFLLLRSMSTRVGAVELVTTVLAVATLLVLAGAVHRVLPVLSPVGPRVLLAGAILWAGATVVLAGVLAGSLVDAPRGGFTAGQTGATLLWLMTAAALLLRGWRGSSVAVPAGLAVAACSVGKLLVFDLAFLDGIARVLSFIVGGLLLLAMGAGYAQALERSRRPKVPVDNPPAEGPAPPTV